VSKEVYEELAKKEIHKALRSRITAEQAKLELSSVNTQQLRKPVIQRNDTRRPPQRDTRPPRPAPSRGPPSRAPPARAAPSRVDLKVDEKKKLGEMLESLIGTRGAYLLDEKLNILGKVPYTELHGTLKSLNTGVYAVVFDGVVDGELVKVCESSGISHVVAMDNQVKGNVHVNIVTAAQL